MKLSCLNRSKIKLQLIRLCLIMITIIFFIYFNPLKMMVDNLSTLLSFKGLQISVLRQCKTKWYNINIEIVTNLLIPNMSGQFTGKEAKYRPEVELFLSRVYKHLVSSSNTAETDTKFDPFGFRSSGQHHVVRC